MSAFVMALAAGMAVGSGPEAVSGEVEQGLSLQGRWEGEFIDDSGGFWKVVMDGFFAERTKPLHQTKEYFQVWDHGKGKADVFWGGHWHAIYRQNGDRVTICYRPWRDELPSGFYSDPGKQQGLLTLRRVRRGK